MPKAKNLLTDEHIKAYIKEVGAWEHGDTGKVGLRGKSAIRCYHHKAAIQAVMV